MKKNERKVNAARICFGISRIGYTPASAICDIIDNAVSAHANNIHVIIKKKNESYNNNKKDNIEEYLIIDDGCGMNKQGIGNALDLGSSNADYDVDSLSKFGLGLKSASFAQGNKLEVISGDGEGIFKEYVDLEEIDDTYFSVEEDLSDDDNELVNKYFHGGKRGTIIRISKIHNNNHPSVRSTVDELKEKIGVIYYYFLEKELHIYVEDEEMCPIDPLFISEAGDNNLDENVWDGKSVQWLLRPKELLLDEEAGVKSKIEITMLPHPQVWKDEGKSANDIRSRYHIKASNYGFYIYRNKRLINWANKLDGIIPQDQDFYAFRGRINISTKADDAFNIDVSKSHIILSEDAKDTLDDYISDYKKKCKAAWNGAYNKYKAKLSADTNEVSNEITNDIESVIDNYDYEEDTPEYNEEIKKREERIEKQNREKDVNDTLTRMRDEGMPADRDNITEEDILYTMKGKRSASELDKIFKVPSIVDNILWEPYVDAEKKECVRIATSHRFSKVIYENNSANSGLQVLFELLMYIQAKSELQIRKSFQGVEYEKLSDALEEYRLLVSEKLATLCRKEEYKLPPHIGE